MPRFCVAAQRIDSIRSTIGLDQLVAILALACAGCSLAVSTDGLSGGSDAPVAEDLVRAPSAPEPDDDGAPSGSGSGGSNRGPSSSSSSSSDACDGTTFEGHCYLVVERGNFEESVARCAERNAHLVTITSGAEQGVVAGIAGKIGSVWIGLKASSPTNDRAAFAWITGEAKAVDFWYVGQPNGGYGYAVMHHSNMQWRDVNATNTYPAVCERE